METAAINKDYAMLPAPFQERANVMGCPASGETLHLEAGVFESSSGRRYPIEDGIPNLFVYVDPSMSDRDVTDMVQAFYEETPFPNYDDLDSRESLAAKARRSAFAVALDEQLPHGATVLEAEGRVAGQWKCGR